MYGIKFEYVFAVALLAVLTGALVLFRENSELVNLIIGSLVGGFGAITAYFFTKYNHNK
ncbi:hypothetical protein [Fictibacillus phosphorivorans]|uniref:hypothetical protein n=1 Tax=Fictibacillus phosphorivorans TaxID=1221500 RepID=UPI000B23787E|nr:hypothetical protein [Fictibacillus phosphorivorans]